MSKKSNGIYEKIESSGGLLSRYSDLVLAFSMICILLLLIIPIQGFALDILIATSIALSLTTLLVTLYSEDVLAFNSFPSFLLFITLFRLGLNIATTRTILTEGHAGHIIQTFGELVTGGNTFVGFLIFLLLTGVNFVVITKGAGRIAEVAARFTLDSLPGKQLSIDADVNAGLIGEEEAKMRRDKIMAESDFYGAMDGASRFVRGDAMAGIVITIINVVGSFIVGISIKGMDITNVIHVYITMVIGDGLVTQIPALFVSVGAGIIVTRSSSRENLSESLRKQLFNNPRVLFITAGTLLVLGLIPGMPFFILATLALAIFLYANMIRKMPAIPYQTTLSEKKVRKGEDLEEGLSLDPMSIELGEELTPFANSITNNGLLQRISAVRRQLALELGIVVPSIRIHDNLSLSSNSYVIKIKGNTIASGKLELTQGLDPLTELINRITDVIRSHAHELLNRQDVSRLLDNVRDHASVVIDELIPMRLKLGQVMHVLQNLLREQISIRDIVTILEVLADYSSVTTDVELLTEYVRQRLARNITSQHMDLEQSIAVISLDPKVEELLIDSIQKNEMGSHISIHPKMEDKIIGEIYRLQHMSLKEQMSPVILTTPSLRPSFKKLIERNLPRVSVLSLNEIVPDVKIRPIGRISQNVLML